MRFIGAVFAAVLVLFTAAPAAAQTFPPQGEFYRDFESNFFTRCDGGFMVGIHARTGAWFNSIGALCATYDPASHQLVPSAPAQIMGFNGGGVVQEKRCPPGQAIEYIAFSEFEQKDTTLGVPGDPFTMLDEIVFRCRGIVTQAESVNDPVIGMTSDDPLEIADMNTTKPYPSGPAVNPGFTHKERCVDGRLAQGLSVGVPGAFEQAPRFQIDGVHGIGLQCVVQPPVPPPFGGGSPPPPPPPPPQPIDTAGGASFPLGRQGGGRQIDIVCPTGKAMIGLYGSGKAGNLDRLDVQCAVYAGRTWSGLPQQGGTLGSGAFPSGRMLKCTPPYAVTALDGDVSSYGGIARLRLRCGSQATDYMGRGAPNNLENWTHGTITCGPNNVATGIYGWLDASGAVQSFGLHCLPANAFSGGPSGGGGMGSASGGGAGGTPSGGSSTASLNDFAGTWHVMVNSGYSYTMTLFVSGGAIRGTYDVGRANGQVNNGLLSAGTLTMDLSQTSVIVGSGKGTFKFVDPVTLKGTWSIGPFSGTWTATR
ncbi:MAG: hypothetical protein WDN01_12855 [Rhizomicrobium sp.]